MVAMIAAVAFLAIVVVGSLLLVHAGQNQPFSKDEQAYEKWVNGFATGLGGRPAVVILEPDALALQNNCPDNAQRQARLQMLSYAVKTLQTKNAQVYLDAGHSNWVPAGQMARRLQAADIAQAAGFALNVANYDPTNREISYATELDRDLRMDKRFVVDTSRNGPGSAGGHDPPAGSLSRARPDANRNALARQLFTDPNSQAANWVRDNPGDPLTREISQRIANQPTAKWFGPWSGDISAAVSTYASAASKQHKAPVLVAYDIPQLDCSGKATGSKQWCNPPGRQLGSAPQVLDGGGGLGLWIKAPGESDGDCGTGVGTRPGEFSPNVAKDLITGRP